MSTVPGLLSAAGKKDYGDRHTEKGQIYRIGLGRASCLYHVSTRAEAASAAGNISTIAEGLLIPSHPG